MGVVEITVEFVNCDAFFRVIQTIFWYESLGHHMVVRIILVFRGFHGGLIHLCELNLLHFVIQIVNHLRYVDSILLGFYLNETNGIRI